MVRVSPLFFFGHMLMGLEIRHKRRITVAAASKILANLTYAYKGYGLSMGTMLAGVRLNPHTISSLSFLPLLSFYLAFDLTVNCR